MVRKWLSVVGRKRRYSHSQAIILIPIEFTFGNLSTLRFSIPPNTLTPGLLGQGFKRVEMRGTAHSLSEGVPDGGQQFDRVA